VEHLGVPCLAVRVGGEADAAAAAGDVRRIPRQAVERACEGRGEIVL
jgi:hypothetical protein